MDQVIGGHCGDGLAADRMDWHSYALVVCVDGIDGEFECVGLVDHLLHGGEHELVERVDLLAHQTALAEEGLHHVPRVLLVPICANKKCMTTTNQIDN